MGKTNKRPNNFRDSARLQYPFYCTVRTIESPKSCSNVTRGNRFDRPGDQRNVEQGCNFRSKKSGGSVSELIDSEGKRDEGNCPVINVKELNKQVHYGHFFKIEGLFLLKKNATARGLYVQDCFERRIFCGSIVKKLPKICQFPMERPVIRIFMSMLRTFFSAISFHQINESSNTETLHKNNNISRRNALDGRFSRGTRIH